MILGFDFLVPVPVVGGCKFISGNAGDMFGDLNALEESVMASVSVSGSGNGCN